MKSRGGQRKGERRKVKGQSKNPDVRTTDEAFDLTFPFFLSAFTCINTF
jgi:hypothetical protein